MIQRGRKGAASLEVVAPFDSGNCDVAGRLLVPPELSQAEAEVWRRTTAAKPADWFGSEHIPMLVAFCRHSCAADDWAARLRALTKAELQGEAGEKRVERLRKLCQGETVFVERLARSMRLSHQTAFRAGTSRGANTGGGQSGKKPWE